MKLRHIWVLIGLATALGQCTEFKHTGWNLMAICENISAASIDMRGIEEIQSQSGESIYSGEFAPYSNLDTLAAGYGYWVKGDEGFDFDGGESAARLIQPLKRTGWNLMGACETLPKGEIDLSEIEEIQSQFGKTIYTGNDAPLSNLDALQQGYGYWVKGGKGSSFTSKKSQRFIEENTGLTWQDDNETNTSLKTFVEAEAYCQNLRIGSYEDWRIPSITELFTIVDNEKFNAATYYQYVNPASYWSSTLYTPDKSLMMGINFYDGSDGLTYKTTPRYTRCVRGELISHPDFVKNDDSIVTDTNHNLVWQDEESIADQFMTHDQAIAYCSELSLLDRSGWRVPTVVELRSVVDRNRTNPAINQTFEKSVNGFFWSSTLYQPDTSKVWSILFTDGNDYQQPKNDKAYVRCVIEN